MSQQDPDALRRKRIAEGVREISPLAHLHASEYAHARTKLRFLASANAGISRDIQTVDVIFFIGDAVRVHDASASLACPCCASPFVSQRAGINQFDSGDECDITCSAHPKWPAAFRELEYRGPPAANSFHA